MSDLARLRAHAQAIAKLPTAATWNFYTRERVVQRAREMLELLDGADAEIARLREIIATSLLGTERPPEHVFEEFRCLHGLASPRPEGEQA